MCRRTLAKRCDVETLHLKEGSSKARDSHCVILIFFYFGLFAFGLSPEPHAGSGNLPVLPSPTGTHYVFLFTCPARHRWGICL